MFSRFQSSYVLKPRSARLEMQLSTIRYHRIPTLSLERFNLNAARFRWWTWGIGLLLKRFFEALARDLTRYSNHGGKLNEDAANQSITQYQMRNPFFGNVEEPIACDQLHCTKIYEFKKIPQLTHCMQPVTIYLLFQRETESFVLPSDLKIPCISACSEILAPANKNYKTRSV